MYSFLRFRERFELFKVAHSVGETIDKGKTGHSFVRDINEVLPVARVFELDNTTVSLLMLTDPSKKIYQARMCYPVMFLNINLTKEQCSYYNIDLGVDEVVGILLREGRLFPSMVEFEKHGDEYAEESIGTDMRLSTLVLDREEDAAIFHTFIENIQLSDGRYNLDKVRMHELPPKTRKLLWNVALNFLNYLNHPDVEQVEVVRSEKNIKRRKNSGKPSLPNNYIRIVVHGVVKRYLGYVSEGIASGKLRYKSWTRGHLRHLFSDYYRNKKVIWIFPFVRNDDGAEQILKSYRLISNEPLSQEAARFARLGRINSGKARA